MLQHTRCSGCPVPHISLPAHLLLCGSTRYAERLCPLHLTLLGDFILNSGAFYSLLPHRVLSTGSTRQPQQHSGLDAGTSSSRAVVPCSWNIKTRPPCPRAGSHFQTWFNFSLSLFPQTGTLMPCIFSNGEAGVHPQSAQIADYKEMTRHIDTGEDEEKDKGFISSIRSVTCLC